MEEKKMSRKCKLVLGNGFDLYCELKTRYSDYFNGKKDFFNKIPDLERRFNEDHFRLNDDYEEDELIPTIDFMPETTVWDLLFYYEPKRKERKNWCDVEQFILDFFNLKETTQTLFDVLYNRVEKESIDFGNNKEWLTIPCVYLINNEAPTNTKIDFATYLLDELKKFESKFGEYINKEFESKLQSAFRTKLIPFIKDVELRWTVSSLDTFNYSPLEKAEGPGFVNYYEKIYHINGDYNHPIFGIDSSKFNVKTPGYIFSKTYRRMTDDFYEGEDIKTTLRNEFDDLVIFGHSLNEQDYSYYFPIFDYMDLMSIASHKGIFFYYHIHEIKKARKIKNDNVENLVAMLNAYEAYKTGKKNDFRLVESLSSQGRLRFRSI